MYLKLSTAVINGRHAVTLCEVSDGRRLQFWYFDPAEPASRDAAVIYARRWVANMTTFQPCFIVD